MDTTSRAADPDDVTGHATDHDGTAHGGTGHSTAHVGKHGTDTGMVTVESAIALCAFVAMCAMLLAGTSAVIDQIRCTDAAREAARLVAMGESDRAQATVGSIAPDGARLIVRPAGDAVTVVVSANPADGLLPGLQVGADAYAVLEPGADGDTR